MSYLSPFAFSTPHSVKLKILSDLGDPEIQWKDDLETLELFLKNIENQSRPLFYVVLHGKLLSKGGNLLYKENPIKVEENGDFSFELEVTSSQEDATLIIVNSEGRIKQERLVITSEDYMSLQEEEIINGNQQYHFSSRIGTTSLTYRQFALQDISILGISPEVSVNYKISDAIKYIPRLIYLEAQAQDIGITLVPNSSSLINVFKFDLFLSYEFKNIFSILDNKIGGKFAIKLIGGWQYITSFANNFGFKNASGPKFSPAIKYYFNKEKWIQFALSYVLLPSNSTEYELGLEYYFKWKNRQWSSSFEASYLSILPSSYGIYMNTYTLGMSFYF